VEAGNENGGYCLLKNNCTHIKERILEKAGLSSKYGK
jgi:hypothetical protein